VIMNDIRLRGLAVAGSKAAGRKSLHNHAQTARNLRRSLRNAAAGARLSRCKGWTANRLPTSRPRLPMLFRSFTGSSASSIDVSDATNDAGPLPASVLDLDRRCRGGLSHLRDPNSGEPSLAGLLSAVQ
jgi:hypothetical protein